MDQAFELRQLVRQDRAHLRAPASDAPHMVAVASGKGGVGTTTVAVNLAVALARLGRRVVLVDADLEGADVGNLCQLNPEHSIADVLRGARDVHEALCPARGGIQVLPGAWMGEAHLACTPRAQERLIAALRGLGPHADDVVLDVGCGAGRANRRFWHASDKVLAVTTAEDAAVMNVYAAIKLIGEGDPRLPVFSLVNFAADAATARPVHDRLALACRRFLGMHLFAGGHLPASAEVRDAVRDREPFVCTQPRCEATLAMEQVAQQLIAPRGEPPAPRMLDRLWQRREAAAERSSASHGDTSDRPTTIQGERLNFAGPGVR
jgi:flagellar biosynthesis protein FlhG